MERNSEPRSDSNHDTQQSWGTQGSGESAQQPANPHSADTTNSPPPRPEPGPVRRFGQKLGDAVIWLRPGTVHCGPTLVFVGTSLVLSGWLVVRVVVASSKRRSDGSRQTGSDALT